MLEGIWSLYEVKYYVRGYTDKSEGFISASRSLRLLIVVWVSSYMSVLSDDKSSEHVM